VTPDPLLRRVERTAAVACVVMTIAAYAIARTWRPPLGVVGGWLLIEVAFRAIHSGIDAMIAGLTGAEKRRGPMAVALLKIAGRYALLAFLAYVMIARLRLHPLGLMAGASSAVAAVSLEAVRLLVNKR
jgi:high-affinity K+ transport system ATPase subunit B